MSAAAATAAPPRPATAAPAAAAPAAAAPVNPLADTAEKIFIQMASSATVIANNTATLPMDAKNLAQLCFELSKAFHEVEISRRAKVEQTVANFDANMCDFDAWSTKPAA